MGSIGDGIPGKKRANRRRSQQLQQKRQRQLSYEVWILIPRHCRPAPLDKFNAYSLADKNLKMSADPSSKNSHQCNGEHQQIWLPKNFRSGVGFSGIKWKIFSVLVWKLSFHSADIIQKFFKSPETIM